MYRASHRASHSKINKSSRCSWPHPSHVTGKAISWKEPRDSCKAGPRGYDATMGQLKSMFVDVCTDRIRQDEQYKIDQFHLRGISGSTSSTHLFSSVSNERSIVTQGGLV